MKSRTTTRKPAVRRKRNALFSMPYLFTRAYQERRQAASKPQSGKPAQKATARRTASRRTTSPVTTGAAAEVISALRNLGYKATDAKAAAQIATERGAAGFDAMFRVAIGSLSKVKNPKTVWVVISKPRGYVVSPHLFKTREEAEGWRKKMSIRVGGPNLHETVPRYLSENPAVNGFVDAKGHFHPIRGSEFYRPKKVGERRTYATKRTRKTRALKAAGQRSLFGRKANPKFWTRRELDKVAKLPKQGRKKLGDRVAALRRGMRGATKVKQDVKKILGDKPERGYRARRNPDQQAKAKKLYAQFHGKRSGQTLERVESSGVRPKLARKLAAQVPPDDYCKLGDLEKLIVDGYGIEFELGRRPIVASNPEGTQLYFIGGDQDLSELVKLQKRATKVDTLQQLVDLGPCEQIEYFSQKKFDNFQPVTYYHELGEETGDVPRLLYDEGKKKMYLAGGAYKVQPEGIRN